MATKTFTNLLEDKLCKVFSTFAYAPSLISVITVSFPKALAYYLNDSMYETEQPQSELSFFEYNDNEKKELMKFVLTANKKGDSISLIPSFDFSDASNKILVKDEFEATTNYIAESLLHDRSEDFNKFLEYFHKVMQGHTFINNEWSVPDIDKCEGTQIKFDEEEDVAYVANTYIFTILEVLHDSKSNDAEIQYEVPGLGVFSVNPTKNGFKVSLSFAKDFKQDCKSDILCEKMFDRIEG